MHTISSLLLVYVVFIGAMFSPGPDFLIVTRNALGHSARAGVFTALGIACGLMIHIGYCIAGIGILIAQSALLFNIIKWIGAGYLVYVGGKSIMSKGMDPDKMRLQSMTAGEDHLPKKDVAAFKNGFVVNLFNPKASMFFLALFSQMLDPSLPLSVQAGFGAFCILTAFCWFSGVSVFMAAQPVRAAYRRAAKWIDRVFGVFFIALAVKLALVLH